MLQSRPNELGVIDTNLNHSNCGVKAGRTNCFSQSEESPAMASLTRKLFKEGSNTQVCCHSRFTGNFIRFWGVGFFCEFM